MTQIINDIMSKLSDFVVIWQFFRLVFRYLWFWQLNYYCLFMDDTIDNVIVDDDIKYSKHFSREAYYDDYGDI